MRPTRSRSRLAAGAEAEAEGIEADTMNYESSSQSLEDKDNDNEGGTTIEHEVPASIPPHSHIRSLPVFSTDSACNILRPLSTVAVQRSLNLPTSGSLASLARRQSQEHDHVQGGQTRDAITTTTTTPANAHHATAGGSEVENSTQDEQVLQSDSHMNATSTPDLASLHGMHTDTDPGVSSATVAVREFAAMLWESPTEEASTAKSEVVLADTNADTTRGGRTRVQSVLSTTYSSSSPLSSPASSSSLAGGFPDPYYYNEEAEIDREIEVSHLRDHQQHQQHSIPSPFAMIFADGTNTTTPIFYQRLDGDQRDDNADQLNVQLCSESIQLFRRRAEDGGSTWKRRVFEYR